MVRQKSGKDGGRKLEEMASAPGDVVILVTGSRGRCWRVHRQRKKYCGRLYPVVVAFFFQDCGTLSCSVTLADFCCHLLLLLLGFLASLSRKEIRSTFISEA